MSCIGFLPLLLSIVVGEIKQNCWPTDIGCKTYTALTISGITHEESVVRDCLSNGDLRMREFNTRYCSGTVTNTTITAAANLPVPCGECYEYGVAEGSIYHLTGGCTGETVGALSFAGPLGCDGKGEFTTCTQSVGIFNTYYENDDCTGAIINEEENLIGKCEDTGSVHLHIDAVYCTEQPTNSPSQMPSAMPTGSPSQMPSENPTLQTNPPTAYPTSVTNAPTTETNSPTGAPTKGTDVPTTGAPTAPTTALPTSAPIESIDSEGKAPRMVINWTCVVFAITALSLK